MTPEREKDLERRVRVLEMQLRELRVFMGKTDADIEAMEMEEALDYMAQHGDSSLINKCLARENARRARV